MNTQKLLASVAVAIFLITGIVGVSRLGYLSHLADTTQPNAVGSVAGPDSFFQTETHNGVPSSFNRVGFTLASSTLCAIKSPTVDSRLEHWSAFFNTVPNFATQYMVGYGTINATTSSLIAVTQISLPAGGLVSASSTIASSTAQVVIPANTWVNMNMSTSTGAVMTSALSPTGRCEAVFMQV